MVGRMIKFLVYLLCLCVVGLVLYAYVGPFFGVDFAAQQNEVRLPVTLNAD